MPFYFLFARCSRKKSTEEYSVSRRGGVASHGSFLRRWAWDTRPISESRDNIAQMSKMLRILILWTIITVFLHWLRRIKPKLRNSDATMTLHFLVATSNFLCTLKCIYN